MQQTEINEVEINGVKYIRKDTVKGIEFDGPVKIVILQRGWVYVGRFERNGNDCKLHNASCIRVWGTKNGLAELVNGPTKDTKLDPCLGVVEFDYLTVVHTITANESKWKI